MVNGRTIEEEKKRIDNFFDNMAKDEFEEMLIECGAKEEPKKRKKNKKENNYMSELLNRYRRDQTYE